MQLGPIGPRTCYYFKNFNYYIMGITNVILVIDVDGRRQKLKLLRFNFHDPFLGLFFII